MRESKPGIVVEQAHRHHQMTGDRLRVAFVQAQQITAHSGVEIGGLHLVRQIGFLRPRRAAVERTARAHPSSFAAPAPILRCLSARCRTLPVRVAAAVTVRPLATAIVIATLEAGLTAPPGVTAIIEVTTTREAGALARFTTAARTSIAGIVTATVELTTRRLTTRGLPTTEPTAGAGVTARAEAAASAGVTARAEAAASAGIAARAEPAARFIAPIFGIAAAFEATAIAGIVVPLEAAALSGPTTAGGLIPALETTALGRIAAAAKATGAAGPIARVPASESTALAAALVGAAAVSATIESAGIVAALESPSLGRAFSPAMTARFAAAVVAAAFPGVTSTVESPTAAVRVLVIASPAGPGIGSAAPEGLPIVVLFRHGAPFLCSARSR